MYIKHDLLPCLPAILLALCFASCGGKADAAKAPADGAGDSRPVLAVSILPQGYFAGRIAGDRVRVMTLVGPGQEPHSYEPSPRQMADLAMAKAWVLSGTEFELALRPKVEALFPNLAIVDGTAGVRFRTLSPSEAHAEEEEEHGDDDDHGDGIDRHTWLGHEPARIMAGHMLEALSAMDPEGAARYRENYGALIIDMDREFAALREELSPLRGKAVFVYHPAFGYFLDEFGIIQVAVEIDGKEPTPKALLSLIDRAKREQAAAIFVQAQFPVGTAKTAADAAGAVLATMDPLAPDWLANIRRMGDILRQHATESPAQNTEGGK